MSVNHLSLSISEAALSGSQNRRQKRARSADFQRAIAVHAVGKAIALTALGCRPTGIVMPTPSQPPCCEISFPARNRALGTRLDEECRLLETLFIQVSGALALVYLNDRDCLGEIGLADIEATYDDVDAFATANDADPWHVLSACDYVFGQLMSRHIETLENFIQKLLSYKQLYECEVYPYLYRIPKTKVGITIAAAWRAPWIGDYAESVQRQFIGS